LRRLESISLLSGSNILFEQEFTFLDDTVRITDIKYDIWGDGTIQYTYSYLYDELGNITLVTYYEGAILKTQNYYEYDEFNQLIIEMHSFRGGTNNTFAYDTIFGKPDRCIKYPYCIARRRYI
jgi:hypothetical protein